MSRAERLGAAAFVLAAFAAAGFAVSFWTGGEHTQLQGLLLGVAFVGIGVGLALWANRLLPGREHTEARTTLRATPDEVAALNAELDRGELVARRVWLRRSAIVAGGALGVALVSPLRSLGPRPGYASAAHPLARRGTCRHRRRRVGVRREVPDGSLLTVFPEGAVGAADVQAVLVRVDPTLLRLAPNRAELGAGRPRRLLQGVHPRRVSGGPL